LKCENEQLKWQLQSSEQQKKTELELAKLQGVIQAQQAQPNPFAALFGPATSVEGLAISFCGENFYPRFL
jgi:hypothetical protein